MAPWLLPVIRTVCQKCYLTFKSHVGFQELEPEEYADQNTKLKEQHTVCDGKKPGYIQTNMSL